MCINLSPGLPMEILLLLNAQYAEILSEFQRPIVLSMKKCLLKARGKQMSMSAEGRRTIGKTYEITENTVPIRN